MSRIGDRLVVTISGDSNIADGVAHPWDGAEHIHIRTDSRTTFPGEEYKIEVIEKGSGYWVGEVRKNIDVRPVNEK